MLNAKGQEGCQDILTIRREVSWYHLTRDEKTKEMIPTMTKSLDDSNKTSNLLEFKSLSCLQFFMNEICISMLSLISIFPFPLVFAKQGFGEGTSLFLAAFSHHPDPELDVMISILARLNTRIVLSHCKWWIPACFGFLRFCSRLKGTASLADAFQFPSNTVKSNLRVSYSRTASTTWSFISLDKNNERNFWNNHSVRNR